MGEIAVEAHLGKDSADSWTLDAFALFEGKVCGDETVDQAGEPDVPESRVGFDSGEQRVLNGIGPCTALFEHSVILGRVGS